MIKRMEKGAPGTGGGKKRRSQGNETGWDVRKKQGIPRIIGEGKKSKGRSAGNWGRSQYSWNYPDKGELT